ncbi:hypothetical protein CAPTEDRAFT_166725 [Capitella teleta]|uniref:Enkurin domain-containing protein n=1 Tax=Capitella teleta TaxID=283909 RepID=R7UKA9_CAPTE|nr:hypothetical protein CAPTEDRAFT_166725 [Capitella teleta]|eukprot:ELU06523.1 hypothetical protein CAPTEDRAFT_166725 [Capitella teleta]
MRLVVTNLNQIAQLASCGIMVSTLNGPIPPHPYFDKGDVRAYLNLVRPEAQDIAQKGQGSVGNLMTLQIEGTRVPSASKSKPQSADHLKDNVRRMRQIQKDARHKQEETKKPVKALWKSSKYENVSSRVMEAIETDSCNAPRPSSANFLRAHSRSGWTPNSRRGSQSAREMASDRPPSVPRATSAREIKLVRNDIDFIKANGKAVRAFSIPRSPSLSALDDLKHKQSSAEVNYQRGKVPKYLESRKKQWKEEEAERIASIPDPEMPVGHRKMEDHERKDTLQKLRQTQKELLTQLGHLPIRTDTLTVRKRKEEIETKLSEIEEAIKIFSRPKVFVKLDT